MKNLKKRIISIFLVLVMVLTMLPANMGVDTAKAADTTGSLSLTYRYGTNNLIQMNTNLPSDTPCVNFTTNDNGCSIDQSGNTVQWVGWIGMDNVDGTIVLTFHFNDAFTEGQAYVLPKGAVFGFTDGKTYALDGDYTFTFDGSAWTMTVENQEELTFELRGGTDTYIQVNTNLPSTTPLKDFLATDNGCNIDQTANTTHNFGYASMANVDGTIVITFNFGTAFTAGQNWIVGQGSVFGFTDGNTYPLDKNYTFTFDGSGWSMTAEAEPEEEIPEELAFEYRYGANNLIQVNTNLPSSTPVADFLATDNGCNIDQSGNQYQQVGYFGMHNVDGLIVLTFHFNSAFEAGQTYVLPQGAIFSFTDGNTYPLDKGYTFTFDGNSWEMSQTVHIVAEKELVPGHTDTTLVQFNGFYDFGVPSDDTSLTFSGTVMLNGEIVENPSFVGYLNNTTICLKNISHQNKVLTIMAGSVISYDGVGVKVSKTFNMMHNGSAWTEVDSIYSDVEGDANGDATVDSMDLIRLKKVVDKAKDANNQCDLDANQKQNGVDVHYLRLIILYGFISNLDVLDPLLYMGGENFVTFADLPVDATDTSKIAEFKALGFNTSLLTEDHASISYSVTLDKSETAEIELGEGEQLLELTHTQFTNDGKMIQIQTNLPSDKTYSDFLLGDGDHVLDVVSDNTIGYFQLWKDSSSNIVYFNPMYNSSCDNGDQYILKAGSKLNVDGVYYVLDRTYTFTIQNEYLASIQNLDKAGLNVWIRNYSNQAGYFTDYMTNLLALHKDKIDGYYIIDEPFATTELYEYSKKEYSSSEITDSFENISSDLVLWFNTHYADTYFHINHVPMSSYNHYGTKGDTKADPAKYATFFDTYVTNILANVSTSNEKKTIGYDYYPFGYAEDEEYLWGLITQTEFYTTGIAPNYLVNMLIPAHKAKASGATFSTCIQTFNNTYNNKTREITTAAEVSFQLYTAMSCGADMFEYFTYNSGSGFEGIMNSDGTGRIYNEVKEANTNAFSFADVINVFDWQGAQVSSGSSTNKNATGIATAENAGLGLLIDDSSNGVLSSVSSDDDAVVGYYTKGTQAGYMVANYNDPKVVTTDNTVTLTFADCTKARVYTAVDGKLTSKVVTLTNGSYTHEVAPGGGFFIIPVNAQ